MPGVVAGPRAGGAEACGRTTSGHRQDRVTVTEQRLAPGTFRGPLGRLLLGQLRRHASWRPRPGPGAPSPGPAPRWRCRCGRRLRAGRPASRLARSVAGTPSIRRSGGRRTRRPARRRAGCSTPGAIEISTCRRGRGHGQRPLGPTGQDHRAGGADAEYGHREHGDSGAQPTTTVQRSVELGSAGPASADRAPRRRRPLQGRQEQRSWHGGMALSLDYRGWSQLRGRIPGSERRTQPEARQSKLSGGLDLDHNGLVTAFPNHRGQM